MTTEVSARDAAYIYIWH